jgi:hypothetical protein
MAIPEQDHQPYRSPGGTYECILKSVLEDPTLTNAEFRLLLYAATKQDGWKFYPGHIVRALDRTKFGRGGPRQREHHEGGLPAPAGR